VLFRTSQHERRTKIPTPVSFNNRSLLSSRNIDYDEYERSKSPQKRLNSDGSDQATGINYPETSPLSPKNNSGGAFCLDELNQLLNPSNSIVIENETESKDFSYLNAKTLDASLLHSSAHPGVRNDAHMLQDFSDERRGAPIFSNDPSFAPHHQSAPPSSYRYASTPSNSMLRRDYANHNPSYPPNPRIPEHIMKTCNLTSTPRFEPEFLRSSPSQMDTYAREPQWV